MEEDLEENANNKGEEVFVVIRTDTVIDPRAVMIINLDTLVADITMFRSLGLDDLTFSTDMRRIRDLFQD